MINIDEMKRRVSYEAVDRYVRSNCTVGLGTGTTSYHVIDFISQKLRTGLLTNIICVPTSEATAKQARDLGIPLCSLDCVESVDVCIDGADEVDSDLNLVKGKGGALLREKMVAESAKFRVIVIDESKLLKAGSRLGSLGPVPVEIVRFGATHTVRRLMRISGVRKCELRVDENQQPIETDNKNYLVDLHFTKHIEDYEYICRDLKSIAGVVEHGIFLSIADICLAGMTDGSVETIKKKKNPN